MRFVVRIAILISISWKMHSLGLLISRSKGTVLQFCSQALRLQRLDVFEGDSVQLSCECRSTAPPRTRSRVSHVVTDGSDFMDISIWSFARKFSEPIKYHDFSLNRNKEWVELISKDDDAVGTESGNSASAGCVFPFYYNDMKSGQQVTSYTCSESGREDNTCWCSTTSNYTQDKKWGFCPCATPKRGIRLMAELGTAPGSYCRFPFKYSGTEYFECIYEGRKRCWCGTSYDVDRDNRWGYCPCSTSSIKGAWGSWKDWKSCICGESTYRARECLELYRNIPTGRKVVCEGFAIQAKLCSCLNEPDPTLKFELEVLQSKSTVILPDRHNPASQILITNLTGGDSGWYQCKRGELKRLYSSINDDRIKPIVVYQLNVVSFEEIQVVLLDDGDTIPYENGHHGGDHLVWFWTNWQICDRCGILTGEQKKFGFCYTQEPAGNGMAQHFSSCRSSMIPEIKRMRMQMYTDYMVVKTCKTKCHKSLEKYKLVKIGENVELPTRRPPAFRGVYHATKGETIRLKCPKAYPLLPVTWQFEEKTMHGDIDQLLRHRKKSKRSGHDGKIGTDDQLVIRKITESSIGYFSCFVNRTLSASYSIDVEEHILQKLEGYLDSTIYVILAFVVFVFCSIAYAVIKIEHKAVVAY